MVNLQAKVAPSHIGANYLPSSEERGDGKSFTSKATKRSEIKKNNNNCIQYRQTIYKPMSAKPTISISKTKQTITEDFIFSHFHANYCTGGKPIQKRDVRKKLRFFSRLKFRN